MDIRVDDLTGPDIARLLSDHLDDMRRISPPGHVHALDLAAMRAAPLTMWSAWEGDQVMGCGALVELAPDHGELKSMRTAKPFTRRGVAAAILETILGEAHDRGYKRVSLETGATEPFMPAIALYQRYGFQPCAPFGDYTENAFSRCFSLELAA